MLSRVSDISTKREQFLAIGKHRVRVPIDLHSQLIKFCQRRRYTKMFDGLLYAASIGLIVLQQAEEVTVISVNKSLDL